MKDCEIVCKYYVCEGSCLKGRKGTFKKSCPKCDLYVKKAGAKPKRTNNKKKVLDKIRKSESFDY